jgi:hypothetical protein
MPFDASGLLFSTGVAVLKMGNTPSVYAKLFVKPVIFLEIGGLQACLRQCGLDR